MDQRRLKVGDIVDDYCPRERRLTDHAIVAMIDDTIRQTRCTACDNEHPYKEARTPRTRRKSAPAALYQEVLASVTDGQAPAPPRRANQDTAMNETDTTEAGDPDTAAVPAQPAETDAEGPTADPAHEAAPADEGPVHRPLIRATLPRPEGNTPAAPRPIPEFTVRQSGGRGGGRFREEFRGGFRGAGGGRNGNQQGHGRQGRPGGGSGQQSRGRPGRPGPHKKRSR